MLNQFRSLEGGSPIVLTSDNGIDCKCAFVVLVIVGWGFVVVPDGGVGGVFEEMVFDSGGGFALGVLEELWLGGEEGARGGVLGFHNTILFN